MTDARTLWLRAQDRKRMLRSLGIVLAAYALVFVAALVMGLFAIKEVEEYSGPVMVRLGTPQGEDVRRAVEVPIPESVPVAQTPPAVAQPAPLPKPTPSAAPKAPAAQPSNTAPAVPAPASQVVAPPAPPKPVTIKGSETGNTYDLAFDSGGGDAGRSFYVPIWVYMPLPYEVSGDVFQAIPDQKGLPGTADTRKAVFARAYAEGSSGSWKLRGGKSPAYDARPEIWVMLEEAGYPVEKADYKDGKSLRPVSILFRVSAYRPVVGVILEDILIESSSGYGDIDEVVLYAFSKAEFRNSGKTSVSGRFTYRF